MTEEQAGEQAGTSAGESAPTSDGERRSLWRRIAGDGTHLGFWTLPVFIATALGGAVIAGAFAQVYYAQQVKQLEEETAAARTAAEVAAEDIETARQEALDEISEQLDGVRDALEVARPLEDPATAGVVALTVELTPAPPSPAPSPSPQPSNPQPDTSPTPSSDGEAQGAPLPQGAPADGATDDGEAGGGQAGEGASSGGPPPPVDGAPTRRAVGFVVAVDGGTSFVATTYGAVADSRTPDGVAPAVTVATPSGAVRGVVHAWDEPRGVAVVRIGTGDLPILPWRPAAAAVAQGDVVVLAAVTPGLVGVQLPGRIGAVTETVLVSDLPVDPVFDGAPLLDSVGRVIGLQSSTAAPFGDGSTGAITARQLCVELISGCDLLEQVDESDAPAAEEQPEG